MSFVATVFNVMVASPSDVKAERDAACRVVYNWNTIHADEDNRVLLPLRWETHIASEMGAGSAQEIINQRMLLKSDLLVGIFGNRIGTATNEYVSGAVEEIERHMAAGKPTAIYFSKKPIARNQFDYEQYEAVKKFKQSCISRGACSEFASTARFEKLFNDHLSI